MRILPQIRLSARLSLLAGVLILCMLMAIPARSQEEADSLLNVQLLVADPDYDDEEDYEDDDELVEANDSTDLEYFTAAGYSPLASGRREFNPSPNRAVWLSALLPGLGQVYNRRYWKLPIIVAGYMGLGYATSWNNSQLSDYQQAYRDLMDDNPATDSYMNFFPPTTVEGDLDRSWLEQVLRSRRNYYRRNRDLCIIGMVAVYLLCMVDAYVDATMAHFDISPSLSLDVSPTLFQPPGTRLPAAGINWAFNF